MDKSTRNSRYALLIEWLRQERIARGLTVREVGTLIDEPFQFVSKVENVERKLNVYEFVQYCEALGIDPVVGLGLLKSKSHTQLEEDYF
ncbi:helix-turn-helix domain-containing protein [Marinobacterium mangrovicola]|uniref:Helix-turn-helix protein n=1 Tax=Marinobacterium mangrovicola TaxID=1476959 RepID=A0A4R1GBE5_9GAMM|nr:helix-turn-helix transcriptional regulator [Marinobacterium mangrovicola]TCK02979.1 helix-turn-helix protein [Marinobacterium mangrovicola]